MTSTMVASVTRLRLLWKVLVENIDINWFHGVQWKNCRAPPNTAYIPTKVEHCANVFTHGIWVVPSVFGMVRLLERCHSATQYWAAFVYGTTLILIFTVSTFFHSVFFCSQDAHLKDVLHRCDRAMIYVFIAGSYFPWVTLRPCPAGTCAHHLHWVIWLLALLGIVYQQVFHERYKRLETLCYCTMGVLPALTIIQHWTDFSGMREIQAGGVIYFIGVIFFKSDGAIPFAHAIWHLFVAAAAGVHYSAIAHHLFPLDGPLPPATAALAAPAAPPATVEL